MSNRVAISEFKSKCLEILTNLGKSKTSIIITKRNKPIATVSSFQNKKDSIFGMMKNKGEVKGDIISPIDEEWEANK